MAQAACTQFITNIYENKKKIQDTTYNKLIEFNKIKIAGARHIASHDYDSLNFMAIYSICNNLIKDVPVSELSNIISEIEIEENEIDKKKKKEGETNYESNN